ncbi:GNAT family N-acetyltransferase [Solicola gregarius]|uniref:GNAT family N-acetyltransferase n=1 Tax=Solicola gregarius TaxID=2908642 RepID=A0AA46YL04_9ACTN|nr:GNAT family N-acetyltransferase [Solicola gregarius]UYM06027.1 GNAT family N-acetyltransferase [Solicola gregarius]
MIELRLAKPAEYEQAGQVTVAGYEADGFVNGPDGTEDHYAPQLLDAAKRAGEAELVVAVDESDMVLGTVTWCPVDSPWRELAVRPDQGEFRMLSVLPAARRQGIARALVEWCLERARADGLNEIVLCSLVVMKAAHTLYGSFGFQRAPELDWEPIPGVLLWGFRLKL